METLKTNIATPVPAPTVAVAAPATPGNTYVVGGNHTIDNSAYASGTDANAVALQAYDKQLQAYKQALQASYDAQANSIANEVAKSRQQYIGNRNDTYTNARLSAIGNNERLAAKGLAGNLYDYARSGTSETSRIAQDVAMRKNIAGIDQAQINAQNEFQLALINAQKEADANYANKAAEIEIAKIPYLTALAQAAAMSSGGGSGGGYSYSRSSSGGGSGGSSGSVTTAQQYLDAVKSAVGSNPRDVLTGAVNPNAVQEGKKAGMSQSEINKALSTAINNYSAAAKKNLQSGNGGATSTNKYSSRYVEPAKGNGGR